ncbi:Cap15 family cyclic dinucleotide receptor domain-containing protein [Streptosporangium sandarakinum]|uniref:Cap15 family cyclic dinucleotide receptor domain-containing protein n=1 Tax=Streptosporangium sandarakinum TaxID=1260955 RepID=UPI0036A8489A
MHAYSSSDSRAQALGMIAFLAVLLAMAANALTDYLGIGPAWLISAPTVAAAFALLYRLVDTVAWRWSVLHRLGVIQVPVIEGTYEGHLVSSYKQTKLPVRICIDQTWTRIAIRFDVLEPKSSTSYSITAGLGTDGHDHARLTYSYRNQTRPGVAEADMNDHDGTAEVVVACLTGEINGRYFNFRGRQGTLALTRTTTSKLLPADG